MRARRPAALLTALAAAAGGTVWAQPRWLARLLSRQRYVVVHVPTSARVVAVTLDDGPDPSLTPRVLEVLAAHGARATFFVLGSRVAEHPACARAVSEGGHELGNHGWSDTPAVLASAPRFRDDLDRTGRAIQEAAGTVPGLTRPGSGWVRPRQVRDARARGLTTVLGSIAVRDAEVHDVEREVRFVLDRLQPGAVIVLHEGGPSRAGVLDLLDRLLPELSRRGYRTVTVTELLATSEAAPGLRGPARSGT